MKWRWNESGRVLLADDGRTVLALGDDGDPTPQDAALIAAAPELLVAITVALDDDASAQETLRTIGDVLSMYEYWDLAQWLEDKASAEEDAIERVRAL